MSRRTLRGAIPTTDGILASTAAEGVAPGAAGGAPGSGATVFRPAPGEEVGDPPSPGDGVVVGTDTILLRGPEAARARRLDLVGDNDLAGLTAVGPWAEQLDDAREQARTSGFQQGRQEGLSAGLETARTQVERDRADLGRLVESAIESLEASCGELGEYLTHRTVDLALGIARAVLDREVAASEDPGAEAIARCLELVPDRGCLMVRLSPDDYERLGPVPGVGDRELTATPDPSLGSGDAIVTVDEVTIDARLSEALRRVKEALGSGGAALGEMP